MTDHITIPRALLEQALAQVRCNTDNMQIGMSKSIQRLCAKENKKVLEEIRAELLKKPVEQVEPFAHTTGVFSGRFTVEPVNRAAVIPAGIALYLHPPTVQHDAPDVSGRKPMSDAEKDVMWQKANAERNRLSRQSFIDGVDSAEVFHGIKEGGAA